MASPTVAGQRRLDHLGASMSSTWRAKLLPREARIERCGAPEGGPIAGPCPRTWGALDRISVDDVRRCTICSTFVHYSPDVGTALRWRHRPIVIDLAAEREPGDLTPPLSEPYSGSVVIEGRRTSRVELGPVAVAGDASVVAEFFANCARLESLAVTAFAHLYEELTAHDAPVSLRRRALEAAHEETQHVRVMEALAGRRSSWHPGFDASAAAPRRSAFEVAHENAVEGCVRETYGALVARHRAERASRENACALEKIAIDEASHAALSWDVARWIEPRLTASERRELAAARRAALEDLRSELASPVYPELVAHAGCPDAATARAFVQAVARDVEAYESV